MSNKCLVTKLNNVVEGNNSLLKIGEFRIRQQKISAPTALTQAIQLQGNNTIHIDVEIKGNGYFTDATLSQNLGKKLTDVGNNTTIYVSNDDCEIAITNKYAVSYLNFRESQLQWRNPVLAINKQLVLHDLKYSPELTFLTADCIGDLLDISGLTKLNVLNISSGISEVTGDLSNLANMTGMTYLSLGSKVTGDLSNLANMTGMTYLSLGSKVTGDLSNLANMTGMAQLYFAYSGITGDISALASMPRLSNVITSSNIMGNISTLKNCSMLNSINILGSALTGDLAIMPDRFYQLDSAGNCSFTWSSRKPSAYIISIGSYNGNSAIITNIDKMLQDQSNCVVPSSDSKIIEVRGTRTSASDAAVATLQQKGYTVSITPA